MEIGHVVLPVICQTFPLYDPCTYLELDKFYTMNKANQTILMDKSSNVSAIKLNHINLCTSDVISLAEIFTRHFDFKVLQQNAESAMLKGSDGFSLVLTAIDQNSQRVYPNSFLFNFHISFHVGFVLEHQDHVKNTNLPTLLPKKITVAPHSVNKVIQVPVFQAILSGLKNRN